MGEGTSIRLSGEHDGVGIDEQGMERQRKGEERAT